MPFRIVGQTSKAGAGSGNFVFEYFHGPVPLDEYNTAGITPDRVFAARRIDDITAAVVIARLVGLNAVEHQDGLEPFVAMAGNGGAGLIFQQRHARLITLEGADPVNGDSIAEGAEFQLLPAT
ncbi:hypothetical protein BAE36_24175 [Rhizobium leguminosarum bv. trifolii]|uniref:Uncharacterized protein n=1 Tax=Rhizobium leguminosarum bv. trifolii TaxID=386 RepID=A0A1B8R795_RHILT|nr:hypothetical protein [Rhizobium leguminosarum bv. trifolii]OBY04686.1 hypothetical protein BAE36_24175 [Rhizobium leguminosarum bv. trifolii]